MTRKQAQDLQAPQRAQDDALWLLSLVNGLTDAVIALDGYQRVVFMNQAAVDMTGCMIAEGQDLFFSNFVTSEDRHNVMAFIEAMKLDATIHQDRDKECRFFGLKANGDIFNASMTVLRNKNLMGPDITIVVKDVSDEMSRAQILRTSDTKLRTLTTLSSDWIWEMDKDLRYTHLSHNFTVSTGIDAESVLGLTREEFGSLDDKTDGWAQVQLLMTRRQPFRNFRYSVRRASGEALYFQASGVPVFDQDRVFTGYVGTGSNVTELEESRLDLEQQKSMFETIFRSIPAAISLTDMDRCILAVNPGFTEIFGYSPDEVIGDTPRLLYSSGDEYDQWGQARYSANPSDRGKMQEITYLTKEGKHIEAETFGTFIQSADGEPTGYVAVTTDVTERNKMHETLQQSQKMQAIGQLTGGVAHDFNNLLTIISGNLRYLSRHIKNGTTPEDMDDVLVDTDSAVADGVALTGSLLSFARKQPMKKETVNINDALAGVVKLVGRLLPTNISLSLRTNATHGANVNIDPTQFENVIINVTLNARDAMPEGGNIHIATSRGLIAEDGSVESRNATRKGIIISITDDGNGMSTDVIERAVEPFFTTKDIGEGTGLGLSMAFGFASQSGGGLKIESQEGEGTTVRLLLPEMEIRGIENCQAHDIQETEGDDCVLPVNEGTILIVEDESGLQRLIQRHFRELGYTVLTASTPAQAKGIISSQNVGVMISDIMMPGGIKGTELAYWVLNNAPETGVVLITGYNEESIVDFIADEVPILHKPFDMHKLQKIVETRLVAPIAAAS